MRSPYQPVEGSLLVTSSIWGNNKLLFCLSHCYFWLSLAAELNLNWYSFLSSILPFPFFNSFSFLIYGLRFSFSFFPPKELEINLRSKLNQLEQIVVSETLMRVVRTDIPVLVDCRSWYIQMLKWFIFDKLCTILYIYSLYFGAKYIWIYCFTYQNVQNNYCSLL